MKLLFIKTLFNKYLNKYPIITTSIATGGIHGGGDYIC